MRTSTVLFLVVFLSIASSERRRDKFLGFFEKVGDHIGQVVSSHHCSSRGSSRSTLAVPEDAHSRDLRDRLREAERRDGAAANAVRTLERGLASLTDKTRKLRNDLSRDDAAGDIVSRTLDALARQEAELKNELAELGGVRAQLQGEVVRLQSELDLAVVRAEREASERFLEPTRKSALDQLATGR